MADESILCEDQFKAWENAYKGWETCKREHDGIDEDQFVTLFQAMGACGSAVAATASTGPMAVAVGGFAGVECLAVFMEMIKRQGEWRAKGLECRVARLESRLAAVEYHLCVGKPETDAAETPNFGPNLTGSWDKDSVTIEPVGDPSRFRLRGSFIAENTGAADAPASTLRVEVQCFGCVDGTTHVLADLAVGALRAGGEERVDLDLLLPPSIVPGEAQFLELTAILDANKDIEEVPEGGNARILIVKV